MSNPIPASDIRAYIADHMTSVFETMLAMKASPSVENTAVEFTNERMSGSVGFAGKTITGSLYLHISEPFARQATSAMLGLPLEEVTNPAEVNDVMGEITNMLGGGLKSWFCDRDAACVLTTPSVIRGTSFAVIANASIEVVQVAFDSGTMRGLVEVHVKFQ
ncbi:MAG TPA: chemotaxis protein CheX [Candidatus Paceibacterota bacterium]|nr:chemotaxis protein CheX [Candidatus Paceibacterota bacterium]